MFKLKVIASLKKATALKILSSLAISSTVTCGLYSLNAGGVPIILIGDLPFLELFMKHSHGWYCDRWQIRAILTASTNMTSVTSNQIISHLCFPNVVGGWDVPTIDESNFYFNLSQLQALNLSTRIFRATNRVYNSLSDYIGDLIRIDDTNIFPDAISYHERQLPLAFRREAYGFFYQQIPFYEEIEMVSLIMNEVEEYDNITLDLNTTRSHEAELEITFLNRK
jgi:hypothetical protein